MVGDLVDIDPAVLASLSAARRCPAARSRSCFHCCPGWRRLQFGQQVRRTTSGVGSSGSAELHFRFRCYRTPNSAVWRAAARAAERWIAGNPMQQHRRGRMVLPVARSLGENGMASVLLRRLILVPRNAIPRDYRQVGAAAPARPRGATCDVGALAHEPASSIAVAWCGVRSGQMSPQRVRERKEVHFDLLALGDKFARICLISTWCQGRNRVSPLSCSNITISMLPILADTNKHTIATF